MPGGPAVNFPPGFVEPVSARPAALGSADDDGVHGRRVQRLDEDVAGAGRVAGSDRDECPSQAERLLDFGAELGGLGGAGHEVIGLAAVDAAVAVVRVTHPEAALAMAPAMRLDVDAGEVPAGDH